MCKFYDALYEFAWESLRATTKSLQRQEIHNGKSQTMTRKPLWIAQQGPLNSTDPLVKNSISAILKIDQATVKAL